MMRFISIMARYATVHFDITGLTTKILLIGG